MLNGIIPADGGVPPNEDVIGVVSAIIWALTLLPLIKYVSVKADASVKFIKTLVFSASLHCISVLEKGREASLPSLWHSFLAVRHQKMIASSLHTQRRRSLAVARFPTEPAGLFSRNPSGQS